MQKGEKDPEKKGNWLSRWVEEGLTEPPKKGRAQKIDRYLLRLVALHANMCQVQGTYDRRGGAEIEVSQSNDSGSRLETDYE